MVSKNIHPLWIVCVLIRVIIAIIPLIYNYLTKEKYPKKIINKISDINKFIIILIGSGFLYKAVFGSNDETQIKKVFWHKTRIVHALLFLIAGLNFNNYKFASLILFTDVIYSIIYRFSSGHFNSLIK